MKIDIRFIIALVLIACLFTLWSCKRQNSLNNSGKEATASTNTAIQEVQIHNTETSTTPNHTDLSNTTEEVSGQELVLVNTDKPQVEEPVATNEEQLAAQTDKASLQAFIHTQEKELFKDIDNYNVIAAKNTLNAYLKYIEEYPKDKEYTPVTMFKASELYRSLKQFEASITMMSRITKEFPKFDKAPDCQFLIGFTYENSLKDLAKAKMAYEDFLEQYPKHSLREDVVFSLKFLGKTPEEIIEMMKE